VVEGTRRGSPHLRVWRQVPHGHGRLCDCQRWTGRTSPPRRASRRRSGVLGENIASAGVSIRRGPRRLSGGVLYAALLQRLVAPRHEGEVIMKIVVIGGTGLIGSKLVKDLRDHGHEAVPASLDTGVNTLTREGLTEALEGAAVVVDVSNSPSFE